MNRILGLTNSLENALAQPPEHVGPFVILALAGAVSFIDGEKTSLIGVVGGINLVVAALAAVAGTCLTVFSLVLASSHAAVVNRFASRSERKPTMQQEVAPSDPTWPGAASSAHSRPTSPPP